MKKFLIATTALALTAGAAAADVKISGYGRTGVVYQEDRGVDLNDAIIQVFDTPLLESKAAQGHPSIHRRQQDVAHVGPLEGERTTPAPRSQAEEHGDEAILDG